MKGSLNRAFSFELSMTKQEFFEGFKTFIANESIDRVTQFLNDLTFSKREKPLVGSCNEEGFKIKRNIRAMMGGRTAVAIGNIVETDNGIIVNVQIKGFDYFFIPLYMILGIVFFLSCIGLFFNVGAGIGVIVSIIIFFFSRLMMMEDVRFLGVAIKQCIENLKN